MSIRAVIFDIGGVLEATPSLGTVLTRWEVRWQLQPGEMNTRLAHIWQAGSLGTISEAQVRAGIGETFGLSQAQVDAFMDDLWRQYVGELNVDVADYFCGLRPRYRTAIISNSFVGAREREQAQYHFDQMCDCIVYSHEEGIAKPDRRIFERACERLGVLPGEVVFVDDSEVNIAAAQALGMQAILFRDPRQALDEVEACLRSDGNSG